MIVFITAGIAFMFAASSWCTGEEMQCSRYHYEEQTLAKLVRLEFRLELLEKIVNNTAAPDQACSPCRQCPDLWIPFNGSCYLFVNRELNYYDARSNCIELGSHLVYIESSTETEFLRTLLNQNKDSAFYWIGLTDLDTEGQFKYDSSDDLVSFTDWMPKQPDNALGNEDCVHLNFHSNYEWNDNRCHLMFKSICEK